MTEPRCLAELNFSGVFVSGRLRHPRKRLHSIAKMFRREPGKRNAPARGAAEAVFGAEICRGRPGITLELVGPKSDPVGLFRTLLSPAKRPSQVLVVRQFDYGSLADWKTCEPGAYFADGSNSAPRAK